MQKGKIFLPILMVGVLAGTLPLAINTYQIKRAYEIIADRDIFNREVYERVIIDSVNEDIINSIKERGCLIKHRLSHLTSFECPKEIVPELNVREARVFHITDLNADKQIGADKVWAEGITGKGIKIAVLDTGIDTDHPELKDSYLGGYDYVNNDPYPEDDHGHGTHVAGIITSNGVQDNNSKGVASDSGIYMYKVCNADGACYEDDMIAAMEAAVETDAKVMSISIGGGSYTSENCDDDPLAQKVNWVVDQGLTVVVSAGNDGRGVSSPGCASKAIAVGAVDSSNNVPYWSGRGKALDILAPGVSIYSSVIGGYGYMSGTSMAAPHVSGVTALLLETDSNLSTDKIKNVLYETADPANKCYKCIFWWGNTCYRQREVTCDSEITGAGVVNAYEAYLAVKPQQPACTIDADCNDNILCTIDACVDGVCVNTTNDNYCQADGWFDTGNTKWVSITQCTEKEQKEQEYRDYYCDAVLDCQYNITDTQWLDTGEERNKPDGTSCDDGEFCTIEDVCMNGICNVGTQRDCSDNESCTTDSCDEDLDVCVNIWPACGINDGCCGPECNSSNDPDCSSGELCWSGENQYLYRNRSQLKKFCKCAQGTYKYNNYRYFIGRRTVYKYKDAGDNENWEVTSRSSYVPVYKVKCADGVEYPTNKDYYYIQ